MKNNAWLENKEFIQKSTFEDKYYFEILGKHISNYIKNAPIPIVATYDSVNKRIYFTVGSLSKSWEIDIDVSYRDYLTIVNRWLYQFFPKYTIDKQREVSLSEQEIIELRDKALKEDKQFDINKALTLKKVETYKETGIIEKITLTSDEFIFNLNDEKYVHVSGTRLNPLPLSKFLKTIRKIEGDSEKMEFIEENSTLVKKMGNSLNKIHITYQGKQMLNFFIINYPDLYNKELVRVEPLEYEWNNFHIKFESDTLRTDCIKYYEEMRLKNE
jgi:hypothetical protein